MPRGTTKFQDLIHGEVTVNNESLDDQILVRQDGTPTYHFASVVDDYMMGISHVIRGEVSIQSLSVSALGLHVINTQALDPV